MAILAVVVIAGGTMFVTAQKPGFKNGRHFGHRGAMFLKDVDLTAEQKAQVKEILAASREEMTSLETSLRTAREKLKAATANGAYNESEMTVIAREQASLMSQVILEKAKVKSQIFAILTDEQKAQVAKMGEDFEKRFTIGKDARKTL